jgi:DNA-binding PadR family transcriptional regulator
VPQPINAAPTPAAPPLEPATGELSAEEASILAVLAQSGRADDDRTAIAVATSLERETSDVADVLRKLGAEGVVSGELYTAAGDKIWAVTERGVRRLGAQH